MFSGQQRRLGRRQKNKRQRKFEMINVETLLESLFEEIYFILIAKKKKTFEYKLYLSRANVFMRLVNN